MSTVAQATARKALDYVNIVRRRAGAANYGFAQPDEEGNHDERSRELYLESTRRSDLVRNGMFADRVDMAIQQGEHEQQCRNPYRSTSAPDRQLCFYVDALRAARSRRPFPQINPASNIYQTDQYFFNVNQPYSGLLGA